MPARTTKLGIPYDSRSGLHRWDSSLRLGMTILGVVRSLPVGQALHLVCTVSECTNMCHRLEACGLGFPGLLSGKVGSFTLRLGLHSGTGSSPDGSG